MRKMTNILAGKGYEATPNRKPVITSCVDLQIAFDYLLSLINILYTSMGDDVGEAEAHLGLN